MRKRTYSTIFLWLAIGSLLWFFRATAGAILIILLAAASQHELYRMLEKSGARPFRKIGLLIGSLFLAASYWRPELELLPVAIVAIAAISLLLHPADRIDSLSSTLTGFILIPFLLHFFIRILHLVPNPDTGLVLAFWVVILVKFADIGAYLTGSLIGRTKLAPALSPGKTWEGAAGGLLLSALTSAGWVALFKGLDGFPAGLTPRFAAAIAIPIAIVSILSDLLESAFKRKAGVKDSGNTIPGIGGAYDLTDSLTLSVPVAWFFLLNLTT